MAQPSFCLNLAPASNLHSEPCAQSSNTASLVKFTRKPSNRERNRPIKRHVQPVSASISASFHFLFWSSVCFPSYGALCLLFMVMSKSSTNCPGTPHASNVAAPFALSARTRPARSCATNALKAPNIRVSRSSAFTSGPASITPNRTCRFEKQKRCENLRSVMPCSHCIKKLS